MRFKRHRNRGNRSISRTGTAAVEAALILPVLLFTTLAAIDVAQYVNLAQTVSNASREAARHASRDSVESVDEVEALVRDYLLENFPDIKTTGEDSAFQFAMADGDENLLTGDELADIPSGEPVAVHVWFKFSAVRWFNGYDYMNNASHSMTVARRQ